MGIHIQNISAKNLGPLSKFDHTLGLINLIYGHNEKGKTFLVEFIYKSLFKNKALSNLRSFTSSGQLIVSGLEKNQTIFSPSTKKKLEDFWDEDNSGLPKDFSKLLVVKGAELDLASNSAAGLTDQEVNQFLSGEVLLANIGKKIKKTESTAIYEDGKIQGKHLGLIKDYLNFKESIKQLDEYLSKVNIHISGGKRFELKHEINDLKNQLDLQDQAKRHLAYQIANKISDYKSQVEDITKSTLDELRRLITNYTENTSNRDRKKRDFEEKDEACRHYQWLEAAVDKYNDLLQMESQQKTQVKTIWIILTIVSSLLSIFFVLNNQPYISAGLIILSLVFGFMFFRSIKKIPLNDFQKEEREKIKQGYISKFNEVSDFDIAILIANKNELQPMYYSLPLIQKDIDDFSGDLEKIEKEIQMGFFQLTGKSVPFDEWETQLTSLQNKREEIDKKLRSSEIELSKLNVDEDDYLASPVLKESSALNIEEEKIDKFFIDYDQENQRAIEYLLSGKKSELQDQESELQTLKQRICDSTNSDINIDWEELIEKLVEKRTEKVNQYKQVTAEIISHIYLNDTINEFREIENEKIDESLASEIVGSNLFSTTGHYERIERDGGDFYVSDNFGRYKLSDLSTGAREQALLGLRIGFASKLLNNNALFLILDDAFQHSDWNRREMLVDHMGNLASKNWQIIYFTMDDHIKQLFNHRIKPQFEDAYQIIELGD